MRLPIAARNSARDRALRARWSGRRGSAGRRAGRGRERRWSGRCPGRRGRRRSGRRLGSSGSSSRLVSTLPRKSQEPKRRETRLVCLPCQPMPALLGQRLFHQGRGVDEGLGLAGELLGDLAGELLQPALDQLVVVAALGVDGDRRRDPSARAPPADRRPAHRSCRARWRSAPPATWPRGWPRRSAVSAIQSIVPWRPSSTKAASRAPAGQGSVDRGEAAGVEAPAAAPGSGWSPSGL